MEENYLDLMGYQVHRATTDKLERLLNGMVEGWGVSQITHVGGRDWVVIATREHETQAEKQDYLDAMA